MAAIWAFSKNVPLSVCADARLLGGGTNLQYPAGNEHGQAGWDAGFMFNNIGDLSEKLGQAAGQVTGGISRLAINVHGSPGQIDADSSGKGYNFTELWRKYSSPLVFINRLLNAGAPVLIMGCQAAAGDEGASFLCEMSTRVFPGRRVVGFTTIGVSMRQYRKSEYCTEPGMRDSNYDMPSEGLPEIQRQREKEVLTLPWASETSPHAKIALDGKIIAGAEASPEAVNYAFQSYLPGSWLAVIGDWSGYFVFEANGKVSWMDASMRPHRGKWWTMAGSIDWSFSDDPPGWVRQFEILTPMKSTMNGAVTINGVQHGYFTMSKQT